MAADKLLGGGCRSTSLQPARYTNKRYNLCALAGYQRRHRAQHRDNAASSWGPEHASSGTKLKPTPTRVRSYGYIKVRMLKAEAIAAALYGCVMWSPNTRVYNMFTNPCSSDASAGGNGSAATAPFLTPTLLRRQIARALMGQCGNGGYFSRGVRGLYIYGGETSSTDRGFWGNIKVGGNCFPGGKYKD